MPAGTELLAPNIMTAVGLGDAELRRIGSFFRERTGISLDHTKRQMIEARLRRRLLALQLPDYRAYLDYLFSPAGVAEYDHVVDCLTTHKTDFFREIGHFHFLEREALPTLLEQSGARCVRLWSAAASTGEEPYSMAMVVDTFLARRAGHSFEVVGTDVSRPAIEHAERAIYPLAGLASVPQPLRQRYTMLPRDRRRQVGKIVPELRRAVRLTVANLIQPQSLALGTFDIIFLRNVLIYFDAPTQQRVVQTVLQRLRPGGYLLVGHTENINRLTIDGLCPCQPSIFRLTPR